MHYFYMFIIYNLFVLKYASVIINNILHYIYEMKIYKNYSLYQKSIFYNKVKS